MSINRDEKEIEKWVNSRNDPKINEVNNAKRLQLTNNFEKHFTENFNKSIENSDSISRLFDSGDPLLKVMDSNDASVGNYPYTDSRMVLSLNTVNVLEKFILPSVVQGTPTLSPNGANDVVINFALKSHKNHPKGLNLGESQFGPFNRDEDNNVIFSDKTLSIWSMDRHGDQELARNHVQITKVILAKTIDENRFYSEKYQLKGSSIESLFGTADQIVGSNRLELVGIPSKPYHYNVFIHGEDGSVLPLQTDFVFNRENAQPYLDKLAENRKAIAPYFEPTDGKSFIYQAENTGREFIKKTKIPEKIVEIATDLGANVDAIVSNKKSSIKNSFVGNLIFSEASKYNDRYNRQGQPDKSAIQLIMKHEGFVGDTGNSKTTLIKKSDTKGSVVGHGMNLKFMEKNERDFYNRVTRNGKLPMDKDDAAELTRMRVSGIVSKFNKTKSFKWASMSRNRKDALINVVYQNGWSGFTKGFEETVKLIKAGEWTKASEEIVKSSWGRTYKTRAKEIQKLLKDG